MKNPAGDSLILDAVDSRILTAIHTNGAMTNRAIARHAGIAAPSCLRRVHRLEEAGVIRGYYADPDLPKLGWEITFFAVVGLDSEKESVLAAFEQLAASWPEVRECHVIRGGGDFLLKLVARDTAHEDLLTQRLIDAPAVSRVQTLQTIRSSRSWAGVPLDADYRHPAPTTADPMLVDGPNPSSEPEAASMGSTLLSGFASATRAAGRAAHAKQLAVPGRVGGRAVEITPEGRPRPIDEGHDWSPEDWKLNKVR